MIDVNDNNFKLLKMSESLLSKLDKDSEEFLDTLNKYRELAIKIDLANYDRFIEKVNNYQIGSTKEEEISLLEELENEYNQLNELQYKFRNIYQIYTSSNLELSDLGKIDIDKITNRKDLLNNYLINSKRMSMTKDKLDECNQELVKNDKISERNYLEYKRLEQDLRDRFLSAEGRISGEQLKYTSVKLEYQDNGFDIDKLFSDDKLLDDAYREVTNNQSEKIETIRVALICYNKIPSRENKDMLDALRREEIVAKYRFILIKILKFIKKDVSSYDEMVEKREKLLDLIKIRRKYLKDIGYEYVVDPFNMINLDKQLEYLKSSLKDNLKEINRIRKSINELMMQLDDMNDKNKEYLLEINSMSLVFSSNDLEDDIDTNDLKITSNQVVSINDIKEDIKLSKVYAKTGSVIRRVYQMINEEVSRESISPILEIENVTPIDDVIEEKLDIDDDLGKEDSVEIEKITDITTDDSQLFSDNGSNPFGEILLYNDRVNEYNNEEEPVLMPDIFWEVKEEGSEDEKIMSIDDQVKKLKLVS